MSLTLASPASAQQVPRADGLRGGVALRPSRGSTEPVVRRAAAPLTRIEVSRPMPAPAWVAERYLLAANAEGAQAFVERFADERGNSVYLFNGLRDLASAGCKTG